MAAITDLSLYTELRVLHGHAVALRAATYPDRDDLVTLASEFFAWLAETRSDVPFEVFEHAHDLAPGQSHLLVTVRLLSRASQLDAADLI